ncbi:hypothetical protein CO051_02115 [Candidatus Roizmanbacteria bacterium CG_4_9_14_0_2_um_filter_39_13]|uniref:Cohesin domain-containing protein n=2 Tax=Candidatus Roizmaniibacteriota TaxID=1752723 RepID=A0A2M8F1A4_9BACT|nr:MAG: hypothetical protein COY15_05940 [Candidatus Roizmanbacteria bacterium CG_4_10_14_0_2_um_filter_39_12]PJC33056.1 MAG: hypothetical protein CO051_02115 [Candidatus Roizmanbacteria bacterium CG_4_9_14_0_2_um_filter_39_13]PJE61708.1 MAG: hypothetical protein COU87_03130 [Candidatus Roizmanbacteria bacterium CG10_big_fil_rev_8_21_14_0_10_39_12]
MENQNQSYGPIDSQQMISEKKPAAHNVRMIFITIVVLLIALGGYVVLSNQNLKVQVQQALKLVPVIPEKNSKENDIDLFISEIQDRNIPWIEARADKEEVSVGENVMVTIYGFSGGKDITGYDALIGIDPEAFEVISIDSVMPGFQIFKFDKGLYQSITGIKDIQVKDPTVFDESALVTLTLKTKKKGENIVTILTSKDGEQTKFVDNDVQILTPQIGSVFITVN